MTKKNALRRNKKSSPPKAELVPDRFLFFPFTGLILPPLLAAANRARTARRPGRS